MWCSEKTQWLKHHARFRIERIALTGTVLSCMLVACNSSSLSESPGQMNACAEGSTSCSNPPDSAPEDVAAETPVDNPAWPFTYEVDTTPDAPPPPPPHLFPAAVAVFPIVSPVPLPTHESGTSAPPYLTPIQLPGFETWLTRISDNDVFGVSNGQAVHLYSKHQAWNSDESMLEVGNHVLDAQTFEIITAIPLSTARNWSNVYPGLMLGVRYNREQDTLNILAGYDLRTEIVTELRVFSGHEKCSFGHQEGNLSRDDRYIVLSCVERSRNQQVLISYDIREDKILGQLDAADNYNWASVSPSGRYILVENNHFPDTNPRLLRYSLQFDQRTDLGSPAHGDFGYDDQGDEVYVMINENRFIYVQLDDGQRIDIELDPDNYPAGHGHISCRNVHRPGWCYFSSRNTGRVGAIRVSATAGLIEPWGYHYSTSSSYAASPKVTVNRSGTQLLFSSDWQNSAQISDYVLDTRAR